MGSARLSQFDGVAEWIGISVLMLIFMLIAILLIILVIQSRKSNSLLERISISMVDIFEVLFANKEHNTKTLKAFNQLNTLTESQPPALNSIANTLFQLQASVESQAEALKKLIIISLLCIRIS